MEAANQTRLHAMAAKLQALDATCWAELCRTETESDDNNEPEPEEINHQRWISAIDRLKSELAGEKPVPQPSASIQELMVAVQAMRRDRRQTLANLLLEIDGQDSEGDEAFFDSLLMGSA